MIEYASKNDLAAVYRLWGESFGDGEEYINFFISGHNAPCLLYKTDGGAVSMFYLLSGNVRIGAELFPSKYIYAACTAKAHRSRGYMGELIKFAFDEGKKSDDGFVCLVPSEKSLFDYYSKSGFITAFRKYELTVKMDELADFSADVCAKEGVPDFEKITALRSEICGDAFLWNSSAIRYAFEENEFCGGKNLCLDDNSAYALLRGDRVTELCARPESLRAIAKLIVSYGNSTEYSINSIYPLPLGSCAAVNNAMLYPLNSFAASAASKITDAYFGLALE